MPEFEIHTRAIKGETGSLVVVMAQLRYYKSQLDMMSNVLALSGSAGTQIQRNVRRSSGELQDLAGRVSGMKAALEDIVEQYEKAEKSLSAKNTKSSSTTSYSYKKAYAEKSKNHTSEGVVYQADGAAGNAEGKVGLEKYRAYAGGNVSVAEGEMSVASDYGKVAAGGSVAEGKAEVSIGLPGDADVDKRGAGFTGASASASAVAANAYVNSRTGTEENNVHTNANGSVLGAEANAEAGVRVKDGKVSFKAGAGAEAYYAKGEVSLGVTALGIDVDVTVEGMLGVEAKASTEVGTGSAEAEGGLGPIGAKIKVDWSDFELPKIPGLK